MTRSPRLGWAALPCAAVVLAYLNSFAGVFQFDDLNVIVANPTVHSLAAWLADLGSGIRPLLKLTYMANWITGAGEPGFHAVNLAVHLVNTLLVYVLARMLAAGFGASDPNAAACIAALLFGLHPAQTEAVTYISGRSASLMALFYLGGVVAYAAGVSRQNPWLVYLVTPALFIMALATKETAVTFPLALLWWEASRRSEPWNGRAIARRQVMPWGVLAAAAVAVVAHTAYLSRIAPGGNALTQVDAVSYLVLRLVRLYPLNIDPDLRIVAQWNLTLAVEAVGLALLAIAALIAWRRRPWWTLAAAWFVLQLLPTNSLVPREDLANDRHLYLASVGVFIALGMELARAWRPATAALLLVLFVATVVRNRDYQSEVRLWEQTARVSPGKPRAFNNLGLAYSEAGRPEDAERAYREALRLHPGYDVARENLERLQQKTKRPAG